MAFDPASSDFVVYLALFTLYIGIFLLMLPLLNHLWQKWLRFMDGQVMLSLVIVMVFAALILTTQGLRAVQDNPWLLFPLGFFTCLFRLLSPSFLLKGLSSRLGPATNKPWWVDNALVGAGLVVVVGGFVIYFWFCAVTGFFEVGFVGRSFLVF